MVPIDPVDLTSAAPFDPFSYYTHLAIGIVCLSSALFALIARKGSRPHIWAGRLFIGTIFIVAATSFALLTVRFTPPLMVAAVTAIYGVLTAYLALKPGTARVKSAEYALTFILVLALALFLMASIPQVMVGNIPWIGPAIILVIPVILLIGDVNWHSKAKRRSKLRIKRHLSRMIWTFVVVVRAPLAEIYGQIGLPIAALLIGPIIAAPLLIWFFWNRPAVKR